MARNNVKTIEIMSPVSAVAENLRQKIRSGEFVMGTRLRDERSLADEFSVSRGTVRRALGILENERLIVRQQGRGTFVADTAYSAAAGVAPALIGVLVYEKEYYVDAKDHHHGPPN